MENENSTQQPVQYGDTAYATAEQPAPQIVYVQAAPERKSFSTLSIILLALLFFTFFSPLGASLFFPIVVVGIIMAVRYVATGQKVFSNEKGKTTNPVLRLINAIVMVGVVFVLCIVGFIGLVFIGLSTGMMDLDFGS
jgi:hypothetical protein